jgi:DNA-binding CsgD family transcriptional regulator/tetratricopeptide (TPR) repeat protein
MCRQAATPISGVPTLDDGDFFLESLVRQLIRHAAGFQGRPGRSSAEHGDGVLLDLEVDRVRCVLLRADLPREPGLARLSPRELEVAAMVAKGHTNRAIAKALRISLWTVDTHMRRIFAKLQVSTRAAMVAMMAGGALDQQPTAGPPILASDGQQEVEGGERVKDSDRDVVPSMSGGSLPDPARRGARGIVDQSRTWRSTAQGRTELARLLVEPPPVRSDCEGPSALLRPELEVVAFSGREAELSQLEAWCAEPGGFGMRLVTGPAGYGKSRLARQLCARLTTRGWLAGPLDRTELDEVTLRQLHATSVSTLLVVDHAETRTGELASLVNGLAGRQRAGTVGLLLLAHAAGDWWEELRSQVGTLGSVLDGVVELELAPLHTTLDSRQRGFREAVAAFAHHRGHPATPAAMPSLADPKYGSVLNVHVAALAAVLHAEQPAGRPTGPVSPTARVLESEQRHWSDVARASGLGGIYRQVDLDRAVAAATSCGADDEEQAVALLGRIPNLPGSGHVVRLARLLRRLYPCRRSYWGTLQPDLLGEELVARVTADPGIPGGPVGLLGAMLADASAPQAARALTIVATAAPRHVHLREALVPLLQQDPARLLLPAGAVATQVPDPRVLTRAMRIILEDVADGRLIVELARRLPWPSRALTDFALTATQRALEHLRGESGTSDPMTAAELLSILAARLGDTGHRGAALAAIEKAVEHYRELAKAAPDAFLPHLARSLNNLSNQLSDVGRRRAALASIEEAVAIRRQLAQVAPDAFLPDLALVLNNLSNQLSDVGQREAALAAIDEAVEHYRGLAETAPGAFLPNLARSLNNLATSLADVGRPTAALPAAEEAVAISRRLAETARDAFQPDLAMSLNNLSRRLRDVGRREAALAASEEALRQYRGHADAAPDNLSASSPRRSSVSPRSS